MASRKRKAKKVVSQFSNAKEDSGVAQGSGSNAMAVGVPVPQQTYDFVEVPRVVIRTETKTLYSDGSEGTEVITYARSATKQWK